MKDNFKNFMKVILGDILACIIVAIIIFLVNFFKYLF
nr:MAG TPA: hypothetical protein [Caudoviricetes sp.]